VQKHLLNNDLQNALSVMVSCKDIVGEEFALSEIATLITNYTQNKIINKEQMVVMSEIEKALSNCPGWWHLIILKGKAFIAIGDFEEGAKNLAKEMFYIVKEKELNDLIALIRFLRSKRIEQLAQQKLFNRLIEYYEELIIADPAYSLYYFELGKLYAEKNDFDSALIMLRIIIADETYGKDADAIIGQIIVAKELEANRLAIKLENRNSLEIPIVCINDRIFINTVINGKTSSKFLIDTGATISVISFSLSAKLGFAANQMTDMRWFQTAGGRVKKPVVKLNQITIGEIRMQDFLVAVSKDVGSDFDGILGMNFLGRFNFEINSDRSLLILTSK
jgi:clan AA aspartic protease (TIGR02281 family)